jgi:phosphoheptose isomerase
MTIKYKEVVDALQSARHIYLIGDGGSAALADHFACDLLKNCLLPAISLCSNAAILTAIANDYSSDEIFSRQLNVLWQEGDLLMIFSTSGNSRNLIKAAPIAEKSIITVVGGGILSIGEWPGKICCFIKGEDQMSIEDDMLVFCHEVARRLMCKKK